MTSAPAAAPTAAPTPAAFEAATPPAPRGALRRAVLTVVASSACFAISNVGAKWLISPGDPARIGLDGRQVALCRTLGALVFCLALLRFALREPPPARRGALAWRGILGGTSVLLYFTALGHLPVGVATLFNHVSPVFVVLLALLVLGERPRLTTTLAVATVMGGILLVLSPSGSPTLVPRVGLYEGLALASALSSAVTVVLLRDLRKDHGALTLSASFFAGAALFCLWPALTHWHPPTPLQWAVLLLVAVGNLGGQTLFAQSLSTLPAAEASLLSQLSVLLTFGGGYFILGERIGLRGTAGALVAIAGIAWVAFLTSAPATRARQAVRW